MAEMVFCERLRRLRKQAHMTQQDVAEALQIHRTTYTRYESGAVAPDQQGLVQLAQMFGVTVDYLLGYDGVANETTGVMVNLSLQEQQLLQMYRQLSYPEQMELQKQIQKTFQHNRKHKK